MRFFAATLLSVFTVFLLGGCANQNANRLDIDKAFRPLIWPEAKLLAGIDIKKLKQSPLYQKHQDQLNRLLERRGVDGMGIDLRRDVDYIGVSSDGKRVLVFAKGDFKNRSKKDATGGKLVFRNDRVALAGDPEAIRSALALEEKGSGEVPEELAARIHSLPASDEVWLVSRGKLPLADMPMRSDTRSNLGNFVNFINGMTIGAGVETGVKLDARFSCISPEAATRINDGFRGLIGLARLSTKDNETELLKVYDAFQVSKNESTVSVEADVAAQQTERLLQMATRFSER